MSLIRSQNSVNWIPEQLKQKNADFPRENAVFP